MSNTTTCEATPDQLRDQVAVLHDLLSSLAQSLSASWAQLSRIAGDSFTCPAFCAYRSTHQR